MDVVVHCEKQHSCGSLWYPVAPVSPRDFDPSTRLAWEDAYPKALERYYALCQGLVDGFGVRSGTFVYGCGRVVGTNDVGECSERSVSGCCSELRCGSGSSSLDAGRVETCGAGGVVSVQGVRGERSGLVSDVVGDGYGSARVLAANEEFVGDGVGVRCAVASGETCFDRFSRESDGSQGSGVGCVVEERGESVGVKCEDGGIARGKHYLRNRRKRLARSAKKTAVPEWRRGAAPGGVVSEHRGVFAECSQEVQRELRESRARMLVAKNEAAVVQAKADKQKVEAMVKARVYELDVEARRLKLDKDRKKEITEALALLPAGYAETIASEGLTSSVPSLSDGGVSPDSSISVAQVNRMEETIKNLTTRIAELTADNTEAEVKLKARIDMLEDELKRSKKMVDVVGQQFRGLADERPSRKQYVSPFLFD